MASWVTEWRSTLDDICREDWNSLAGPTGFYSSFDWLLGQEPRPDEEVSYFLVRSSEGALVGAVPIKLIKSEPNGRYNPSDLGLRSSPGTPFGLIGSRRGYRGGVLLADLEPHDRLGVTSLMGQAVADFGKQHKIPVYSLYVPDSMLEGNVCIPGCVEARLLGAEAYLPLPEEGYGEVVARNRRRRRQELNRERRRFLEGGYNVSIESPIGLERELGNLLHQLERRYGSGMPLSHYVDYFDRLTASSFPGEVIACRRADELIGFCHFYVFGGTAWCRTAGFRYDALQGRFEYFNLVFWELAELAAQLGFSAIHYGMGSIEAKVNHGALSRGLWALSYQGQA